MENMSGINKIHAALLQHGIIKICNEGEGFDKNDKRKYR
jgi:hypothetical protein